MFANLKKVISEMNFNYFVDVKGSFIGFSIYTSIFLIWLVSFLVERNSWGAFADQISLVIPNGR